MANPILNGADMSLLASYSGGILPVDGDDLTIPKSNKNTLINIQALTAVELASCMIESGHELNIGGSGNALAMQTDRFTHRGSGTVYWDGGTGAGSSGSITANSPNISGDGAIQILGANEPPNEINILNGLAVLGGALGNLAAVILHAGQMLANDNANTIAKYMQNAGEGICQMAITRAIINGGSFTQKIGRGINELSVCAAARVDYESAETIDTAYCAPGATLDLSPQDGDTKKTVINLFAPPGSRVHRSPLVEVTNLFPGSADLLAAGLAEFAGFGGSGALS